MTNAGLARKEFQEAERKRKEMLKESLANRKLEQAKEAAVLAEAHRKRGDLKAACGEWARIHRDVPWRKSSTESVPFHKTKYMRPRY